MVKSIVPALILALGISGCAYTNMFSTGKDGKPAPYDNLQCFEPGNNEGFSFEVPSCYCNGGIRLRYRAHKGKDNRMQFAYELEQGFNSKKVDYTRIIADNKMRIKKVFISGRELPEYKKCNPDDRILWDMAKESFQIWENYEPVAKDLFRTCTEDQIDRQVAEKAGKSKY